MNKCRCHNLPPEGAFTKGKEYQWSYMIDALVAFDDNGNQFTFNEIKFLWYFTIITGK